MFAEKLPPFVHVTVGPDVTPTLSVADTVDAPVWPGVTVKLDGLNDTVGATLSAGGGGGTTGLLPPLLLLPLLLPLLHATIAKAESVSAVLVSSVLKATMGPPRIIFLNLTLWALKCQIALTVTDVTFMLVSQ